jgi:hypothetical protein
VDRDAREQRLKEIAADGRGARARYDLPRWLWVFAIVMAVVCLVPFVHAWLADPGGLSSGDPPPAGSGMGTGIALGFVAGVMVGLAIRRVAGRRG